MKEQCLCYNVIHPDDPHKCALCNRNFSACRYINELQHKITQQAIEIDQLKTDLMKNESKIRKQKADLNTLNAKYTSSLDRINDIQQQKELADREMEELSAELFEEANKLVANEKRQRHQLEELLRYTEDQLNAEQSQLYELRSRIETTTAPSSEKSPSSSSRDDISKAMSKIRTMRIRHEYENSNENDLNTRLLFADLKTQQNSLLSSQKLDGGDIGYFKQLDNSLPTQIYIDFDGKFHPSDSAYFSPPNNKSMEAAKVEFNFWDRQESFPGYSSVQYIQFQNFVEKHQKIRSNSIPSLISDTGSSYSNLRNSANDEDSRLDDIFQLLPPTGTTTLQSSEDLIARVEVEDIIPCLQFGNSHSRMCIKTMMEHMRLAPCFIEPVTLKEARDLPALTNAISSAYYRPIWERLTISSIPSKNLECSACGSTCKMTANELQHNKSYYRFRLTDREDWLFIDQNCRDRLVAVCNFYNFVRNIQMGHYKQRYLHDLYLEHIELRLDIFYSRT